MYVCVCVNHEILCVMCLCVMIEFGQIISFFMFSRNVLLGEQIRTAYHIALNAQP